MMKNISAWALCGALVGLPALSAASPVQFDEAISGDLGNGPLSTFTLDLGLNMIRGQMGAFTFIDQSGEMQFEFDQDPFAFEIAPKQRVTRMSVTAQFLPAGGNTNTLNFDWTWTLADPLTQAIIATDCLSLVGSNCTQVGQARTDIFGSAWDAHSYLVYGDGTFQAAEFLQQAGGSFRYVTTIEVSAVPEPSTMALALLGGIAGLSCSRFRRSKAESISS